MIDRMTTGLFSMFAIAALFVGWYRRTERYHEKARHCVGGQGRRWVGELSERMAKLLWYKYHGERLYSLYVGNYHRGSVA